MSEKLVHVNSYKRGDGTIVKEHYRGVGSNSLTSYGSSPMLTGGVSEDVYLSSGGNLESLGEAGDAVEVVLSLGELASGLALEGIKLASSIKTALKNLDSFGVSQFCEEMNDVLGSINKAYSLSLKAEETMLEKLSITSDERDYKTLYDTYVNHRDLNRASKAIVDRINYATEHGNYDELEQGLREYNSLHTERALGIEERALINSKPVAMNFTEQPLPQMLPDVSSDIQNIIAKGMYKTLEYAVNTGLHDYPQVQKSMISEYMNFKYSRNAYDANELWKAAAYDFEKSGEYIEQNGYLLDTIDCLSEPFHSIVRKKVRQQIGMHDCKGLVLMPGSTLSQEIAMSPEFRAFLREKKSELLSGKVVSGSKEFSSNENLAYALGNADILDTYINKDGDIVSIVFDTYDFNKEDPRWKVEVAYNVQRNGLITNFYTLNIIIIPKEQWML